MLESLKVKEIQPSATNPRGRIDADQLGELVASVKARGVLEPILVRRTTPTALKSADQKRARPYEIVFGHRRLAAALAAGLDEIPALVREIADAEALELQVIENLHRADLHPLEEAEGYRLLIEQHGHTVEDLATKVGKSKAYIYQRLQLAGLPVKAREAFLAGGITPTVALIIARVPEAMREKAAAKILEGRQQRAMEPGKAPGWQRVPITADEARALVRDNYMLELKGAPFSTTDPELLPAAGPCSRCPKRTGNALDLFGDLKDRDLCTDPVCFRAKRDVAWKREVATFEAKGATVLSTAESERVVHSYGSGRETWIQGGYVRPHEKPPGGKKTWGELVKGSLAKAKDAEAPAVFIARHPVTGKPVRLWKESQVKDLVAGGKKGAKEKESAPAKAEREPFDEELEELVVRAAVAAAGKRAVKMPERDFLLTVGKLAFYSFDGALRGEDGKAIAPSQREKTLDRKSVGDLRRLVAAELLDSTSFGEFCAAFGVDEKPLRRQAKSDLDAERAKAAAAAPAKGKGGAKQRSGGRKGAAA